MRGILFSSLAFIACTACGATQESSDTASLNEIPITSIDPNDLMPPPILTRGEFTTAVDAGRFRSIVEPTTHFSDSEPTIYFVGRLKNLPSDSKIDIKWYYDQTSEPMLATTELASDKYQFIASYSPTERKLFTGQYTVRVYANGKEVNARSFHVNRVKASTKGPRVSNVSFSKRVTSKGQPKEPSTKFPVGTDSMYVSFDVSGSDFEQEINVRWMRGLKQFHEDAMKTAGDKRYSTTIQSLGGLPEGTYAVEISIAGQVKKVSHFDIGQASSGPGIIKVAFGLKLNAGNMPPEPMTTFERDTLRIHCGISFMDLPKNTVLEVHWTHVKRRKEKVIFKNSMKLAKGGSGNIGAAWEPGYRLIVGDYKAVILINGKVSSEGEFRVE